MSRGFSITKKTDKNENNNDINSTLSINNRKCAFIKGYCKIILLIIAFIFILCFRTFVIDRVIISGNSMCNTFNDGDICWVKKFGTNKIERYDVIISKVNNKYLIKRVVGLPGEKIKITDGKVYIEGTVLEEDYCDFTKFEGVIKEEYVIADNTYFLLGDNRGDSIDSRFFGSVNSEKIIGKVIFRFYPFTKMKIVGERK